MPFCTRFQNWFQHWHRFWNLMQQGKHWDEELRTALETDEEVSLLSARPCLPKPRKANLCPAFSGQGLLRRFQGRPQQIQASLTERRGGQSKRWSGPTRSWRVGLAVKDLATNITLNNTCKLWQLG